MPISRLGYVNNGTKKEFPVISALPREMTMAEFALLSDEEKMGDIIVTDYPVNEESDYVEVAADGVKTYATLLLELLNSADASKLSRDSKLQSGGDILDCVYWTTLTNEIMFSSVIVNKSTLKAESQTIDVTIGSSASFVWTNGSSSSNLSNTVVPSGTKFTLYYNDAHTFDFNTKAENCIFDPTGTSLSSTNAEDAIKEVDAKVDRGSVSVTADGVKTYDTLLTELYAAVDASKISRMSKLSILYASGAEETYSVMYIDRVGNEYEFSVAQGSNSGMYIKRVRIGSSRIFAKYNASSLAENYLSSVPTSGDTFTLYY